MNKRQLHHFGRQLNIFKPWYFILAAGFFLLLCVYGLRANNLEMVRLRSIVYQADRDNGDVQKALTDLQRYVTSHMNTDLSGGPNSVYPPIQLKYTYERLQAQTVQQSSNEQIYIDAQKHCESINQTDFSGRNRVPCIQEYVLANGAAANNKIPDSLYKFDFMSPAWSPDLAGYSALGVIACMSIALGMWLTRFWIKIQTR